MSVVAKPRMGGHYLEKGLSETGKMKLYIYIYICIYIFIYNEYKDPHELLNPHQIFYMHNVMTACQWAITTERLPYLPEDASNSNAIRWFLCNLAPNPLIRFWSLGAYNNA
jgi:hypothetical protein